MDKPFRISRVGHVGIQVTDIDRSLEWYTGTLGMTLTGRWPMRRDREMVFLRFDDDHHNIVLFSHPPVEPETRDGGYKPLQHIALEIESRDEWLKALAELRRKGVEIVAGPFVHGIEGGHGGQNLNAAPMGASGARSFFFRDPDGNTLEIFTEMMTVPNGEYFPRQEYADIFNNMEVSADLPKAN